MRVRNSKRAPAEPKSDGYDARIDHDPYILSMKQMMARITLIAGPSLRPHMPTEYSYTERHQTSDT